MADSKIDYVDTLLGNPDDDSDDLLIEPSPRDKSPRDDTTPRYVVDLEEGSDYNGSQRNFLSRVLLSPRAKVLIEPRATRVPLWLRIIGKCFLCIVLGAHVLYVLYVLGILDVYQTFMDGNPINNDLINRVLVVGHFCSGILLVVMTTVLLFTRAWMADLVHRLLGLVSIGLAILCGWLGAVYYLLNDVGGLWMRIAFTIYGVSICALGAMSMVSGMFSGIAADSFPIYFKLGKHYEWVLRLYAWAIGSLLYRVLYLISFMFGYTLNPARQSDWERPLDKAFDLFYLVCAAVVELLLIVVRKYKKS